MVNRRLNHRESKPRRLDQFGIVRNSKIYPPDCRIQPIIADKEHSFYVLDALLRSWTYGKYFGLDIPSQTVGSSVGFTYKGFPMKADWIALYVNQIGTLWKPANQRLSKHKFGNPPFDRWSGQNTVPKMTTQFNLSYNLRIDCYEHALQMLT